MKKPSKKKTTSRKKTSAKKTSKSNKKNKKGSFKRTLLKYLFLFALAGLVFLFLLFGTVYIGLFGALPEEEDLKQINNENASELYSSDGISMGKYFHENRSSIGYSDIPSSAINALIATEDSRFFEHEGIDFYSIPRVVFKTLLLGDRSGGGGSTISQQLIKNLYGRTKHGALSMPVNKLKENITALKLEEIYSKEEIITLYLNTVSFGEDVYGIKAASERYFGKVPQKLSTPESACLIGMLKATTTYNPRLNPINALERRNTVLALMVKQGSLSPEEFNNMSAQELGLNYSRQDKQVGSALYLRAHLEPKLLAILEKSKDTKGNTYNLYTDGLRIDLTINSKMQEFAEQSLQAQMKILQKQFNQHWGNQKPWKGDEFLWTEAERSNRYKRLKAKGLSENEIRSNFSQPTSLYAYTPNGLELMEMTPLDSIAYHQMVLQAAFLAVEASSGRVLAYSGGINFAVFPYDHVQAKRQVGSTFKPFVYAEALKMGYQPCDYIENKAITFSDYDDWTPQNSGGKEGGYYTLKGGLAKSVNTVAAKLISETGVDAVRDLAIKSGINNGIPQVPAIALGVADISLMEMVRSYSMFATEGRINQTLIIERISNSEGEVIYEHKTEKALSVLGSDVANQIRSMLELVVDSGTARSMRSRYNYPYALGGKTGTTQNNADGWFLAVTPKIICGAWVGAQSPTVRFRSTRYGQGAATALPIVGSWLNKVVKEQSTRNLVGKDFNKKSPKLELSLMCPLYVESTGALLLEMLFNEDKKGLKRELRKREREEETPSDENKKGGWMKKLLDKLKK